MATTQTETTKLPVAARKALRRLRSLPQKLAGAVLATRERVAAIQANADLTLDAQMRQVEEEREALMETVDTVETTAVESLTAVEGAVEAAGESKGDPATQLLHENRLNRAWGRLRSLLDAGREPLILASEAEQAGDRLAFDALREELPAWMAAHSRTDEEISATIVAIAEYESHLRTPAEQATIEALDTARRLREMVATDVSLIRVDRESCAMLIAEGEDGETVTLDIAPKAPTTGGPVR